jgi:hypothetical protein
MQARDFARQGDHGAAAISLRAAADALDTCPCTSNGNTNGRNLSQNIRSYADNYEENAGDPNELRKIDNWWAQTVNLSPSR